MNLQDKTKSELLSKLKELSQAYDSLKAELEAESSGQKIAEQKLKITSELAEQSEANILAILESTKDSIWAFDRNYDILYLNRSFQNDFEQSFGVRLNKGVNLVKSLPENIKPIWNQRYDRVLAGEHFTIEDAVESEFVKLYIQVTFNPIVKNGQVIGGSCYGSNITGRKQAELKLRESEERHRAMNSVMPDLMFTIDINGTFVDFHAQNTSNLYSDPESFIGKSIYEVLPSQIATLTVGKLQRLFQTGEIQIFNYQLEIGNEQKDFESRMVSCGNDKAITIVRDITERKKAEDKLKNSEEKFRMLAESSAFAIMMHRGDHWIYANRAAEEITGYTPTELCNMHFWDFVHPDYKELIKERGYNRQLGRDVPIAYEFKIIVKNGQEKWVSLTGSTIRFEDQPTALISVTDITERKLAEDALRASEERFRLMADKVPDIIYSLNNEGNIVAINSSAFERYGYTEQDAKGVPFLSFVYPDDREKVLYSFIEALKEQRNYTQGLQFRIAAKNGRLYWFELNSKARFDSNGAYIGENGVLREITERKKAEEALQKSEAIKNKMVSNIGDVIVIFDKDGINQYKSPNIEKWFGWKPQEIVGKYTWDNIHPDDVENVQKFISVIANEPESSGTTELRFLKKDGSFCPIEITVVNLLHDPDIMGFLGNYHDITAKKTNELELITAKEQAQESDRLKSAFLANMSHEIRTPMNGILGFAELLKMPGLSGSQQHEYLAIIEKSGNRMLNIINDIVDISKIEAGVMELNIKESNINEQMEYIYTFFKPEVEAKGMKLLYKNASAAKVIKLKTDREKLYSILTNLVKNAIKYSDQGIIEFGFEIKGRNIEFFIKDSGIGIPKDRQEAIFERFVQADIEDKKARQGAGLGLAITKAYVEILGGKIWVVSDHGSGNECSGSCFYFTLPYHPEPIIETIVQQAESAEKIEIFKKLKVLIAEDDEVSETLITIILKEVSQEIITARTGVEAVEACRKNPDIDLILMDIKMPEMGGYEATRLIRKFNSDVIIIAQTAFGLSGDRTKAVEAGCNDYIAKPIVKAEFQELVQKYFGR